MQGTSKLRQSTDCKI